MLTFDRITMGYGSHILLEDQRLVIEPGAITGLVAPNGYGKTTLLRAIAGLPGARVRGNLDVDGIDPRDGTALKRAVFYAPGDASLLYPNLTVREHLRMAQRLWRSRLSAEDVAEKCGIEPFANKRVRACSQGMKQQVTLAIAYLTDARYLLLDEPMNALDPTNVQLHTKIMRGMAKRGKGIVMSSHILDNVDQVSDTIVFIKNRHLLSHDPSSAADRAIDRYNELYG